MKNSRVFAACLSVFLLSTTGSQATEEGMEQAIALVQLIKPDLLQEYPQPNIPMLLKELPDNKRLAATQFFLNNFTREWRFATCVIPGFKGIEEGQAGVYLEEALQLQSKYTKPEYRGNEEVFAQWFEAVTHSSPEKFTLAREELDAILSTYSIGIESPLRIYPILAEAGRAGITPFTPFVQTYRAFLASPEKMMDRATLEQKLRGFSDLTSLDDYEYKLKNALAWTFDSPEITDGKESISSFELEALLEYRLQNPVIRGVDQNTVVEVSEILLKTTPQRCICTF